jgi:hypothetical protein
MRKFMLHQAIQRAEFGEIAPEHTEIVHEAKGSPDLALARENREEGFPRGDSILECAVNQVQSAADKVNKLRMEFQLADLRVMERTHEAVGIVVENLATGLDHAIPNNEAVEFLGLLAHSERLENPWDAHPARPPFSKRTLCNEVNRPDMAIVVMHERFDLAKDVLGVVEFIRDAALELEREDIRRRPLMYCIAARVRSMKS